MPGRRPVLHNCYCMGDKYFNRDLSWLSFNDRILDEAARENVPLLERFRFLSIYSSNLDEFYRVRFPIISALYILSQKYRLDWRENRVTAASINDIRNTINAQLHKFGQILETRLLPTLSRHGFCLLYDQPVPTSIAAEVSEYFFTRVLGYLKPVFLKYSGDRFFPENNKLYFLLVLNDKGKQRRAILNIPSDHLPRFSTFSANGKNYIVFLDDIVKKHLQHLFGENTIDGCYAVRATRDASLVPEEDYHSDIAELIERQLAKRDFGLVTRFIYSPGLPDSELQIALNYLQIDESSSVQGGSYHHLADLSKLPVDLPELKYRTWSPLPAIRIGPGETIFDQLTARDILIHTPYHNYNTILRFFNESAADPQVTEIYTSIYRIASESQIANALISAAKNGKKVQVVVELKARFDEANNIKWSREMQKAGITIIYSEKKHKVHAKLAVVKRGGGRNTSLYGIIATGNFHEGTARHYTDLALLTADRVLLSDVKKIFHLLTKKNSLFPPGKTFSRLLVAPFNLKSAFLALIDREIKHAKAGLPASIMIKVNNLQEQELISRLYKASRHGVTIHLFVRSVCCLIPGVTGMSENITVTRLIDRYLEHSRIFLFENRGKKDIYIGSADWMNRNIYHRIEVCCPITDDTARQHILRCFGFWQTDNVQAAILDNQLNNLPQKNSSIIKVQAQKAIYDTLSLFPGRRD